MLEKIIQGRGSCHNNQTLEEIVKTLLETSKYHVSQADTEIWGMFIVRIFSRGRQTTKIKHTNIRPQQPICVLIFVGCHKAQKI